MATKPLRKARLTELPSTPRSSPQPSTHRRFASYANEIALIDPKKYGEDPDDATGDKVCDRVQDLAEALGSLCSDEFLTLRCKGCFEDDAQRLFCFVYEPPSGCEPPSTPTPPASLLQYVSGSFKPSLTARIQLAYRLALSIRKIHEDGWLHKGIRSENILFFLTRQNGPRTLDNPRLVGFDFARKQGAGEYSEKPMNTAANIYRHPDALRDPNTTFTRTHDYYGLGIVLFEIAVWRSVKTVLKKHDSLQKEESKESDVRRVRDILLDEDSLENHPGDIAFRMGDVYRGVVERCLRGNFDVPNTATGDELTAAFSRHVVERLHGCVI